MLRELDKYGMNIAALQETKFGFSVEGGVVIGSSLASASAWLLKGRGRGSSSSTPVPSSSVMEGWWWTVESPTKLYNITKSHKSNDRPVSSSFLSSHLGFCTNFLV